MKISIFGVGYVGCVTGACLAREGHTVVGVDRDPVKVERINNGQAPANEPGLGEIIRDVSNSGLLTVVTEARGAIAQSTVSFICVGTPSNAQGNQDLTSIITVAQEIGDSLARKDSFHVIIVRSTVLVGTTEKVIIPVIEERSGGKNGVNFSVCFNPEFLREGSAISDFYNPSRTVIGALDNRGVEVAKEVFAFLNAPVVVTDIRVAEMAKYADNAFHALKISFANEIGAICSCLGISSREVMKILTMDHKLNISPAYLRPGFAFGGSCLPKDLRALTWNAHDLGLDIPLIRSILESNDTCFERGLNLVLETGKDKIGILGITFKGDTDDVRESALVKLAKALISAGKRVLIYDNDLNVSDMHGANRRYIEGELPNLESLLTNSLSELLIQSEVIVVGKKITGILNFLSRPEKEQVIIDLIGWNELHILNSPIIRLNA